jgi:hypothetical protein
MLHLLPIHYFEPGIALKVALNGHKGNSMPIRQKNCKNVTIYENDKNYHLHFILVTFLKISKNIFFLFFRFYCLMSTLI